MTIADLNSIAGRTYPARRRTQNLVGGASPIQATNFSMGNVTLEPNGGQVPWHNQDQEEIYFIVEGRAKCAWAKSACAHDRQAVYIPPKVFHQLTNIGDDAVAHDVLLRTGGRRRALAAGTGRHAAEAGVEAPPLPEGARPQCTEKPKSDESMSNEQYTLSASS